MADILEINKKKYPLLMEETPFTKQFFDFENTINVNGKPMTHGQYNLIISKRDIGLYVKCNMKPNRNWRVSDFKAYFGLKGNGEKLLIRFNDLWSEVEKLNIEIEKL